MEEGGAPSNERATVLIADDEVDLAALYADWLRPDYAVKLAHDPVEAIEVIDETVDVVLLDRRYPDGSGADVLQFIRDSGIDCRVAMVTGVEPGLDIIEMGFDDYVCKPVTEVELRGLTRRLLDQASYQEAVTEFYTLSRKIALLETRFPAAGLRDHDGYVELKTRHDELDTTLTDLVDGFSERQFQSELLNH